MPAELDRRTFLRGGISLAALAVGGSTLLAACSSSTSASAAGGGATAGASGTPSFGALTVRLDWIKHVEFAGEFVADSAGYFKDEGFSSVNLVAGGPSATPAETDLVQGKAMVGLSTPPITAAAVAQGAPLKIIGAIYQKNPYCIVSMNSDPVPNPQAMIGKKIGVQAANVSAWTAFLTANGIDPSSLTTVPVQSDPLVLTTGSIDGWFGYVTNEPIELTQKGYAVNSFLLADYKYPLVAQTFVVTQDFLNANRELLKAFLRAEMRGWKDNLASPTKGATLAVKTYGTDLGLDLAEQVLESYAGNKLVLTPDTAANGLFTMTPALIDGNIATITNSGVKVTASQLFDMSLINEIYQEDATLITSGIPSALPTA
jgi:ABC-type nitrate/sulfonate/bicarbonate transport system substrate-binding protein